MVETLKLWDTTLFLFLNGLHCPFFDGIMYAASWKLTWIPFYMSILYLLIRYWKKDSVWIILALLACVVIADNISSGLIKNLVQRPRPSHNDSLNSVIHLVHNYRGGKYGFVSSHASNTLGFALLSALLFRNRVYGLLVIGWALVVGYSRIYLGVHYPFDILGGMLVGALSAYGCYYALKKYRADIFSNEGPATKLPLLVLGLSFVGIVVYSIFFFR
ncbi:MAG TPA: phosphatase PAP2 family protein [Paludibacter sp.]|nr:phosphatase PAP2 family protein [Paludibacter sp.]